ncbi:MAG: DEAD/DEAH box helicase [Candidatus Omnitrophica bacterium]|nr:DEAD/DEAH box helicase [Candidatus Omnitrophota bacterium]
MKFEKYHISDDIKKNLAKLGFIKPTDIQFKAMPSILKGEDVLAVAQTGTGKTAAFAIPIINMIHSTKRSKRWCGIRCVVMVPTRELALQIGEVFASLSKHTKVKSFALCGGVDQDKQIDRLISGVDILITTPGRMFDLINQEYISLNYVEFLVLDEADHMLELGFIEDIKYVKKMLARKHQTLFFSATISDKIKKLAYSQVRSNAIRIQISPKDPVSKNVTHYVMFVEMDDKRFFLEQFIKDNPASKMIVFVRTKVRAVRVAAAMGRVGIDSLEIHGDKEQDKRTEVMKKFKESQCKLLIATDISARGINVVDIEYVINYDLPVKTENYVHRVGRTGRGFNKGIAISFCSKEERQLLDEIQGFLNKEIEVIKVSKKDYSAVISPASGEHDWKSLIEEEERFKAEKKRKKRTP